jgi:hypothetical protein
MVCGVVITKSLEIFWVTSESEIKRDRQNGLTQFPRFPGESKETKETRESKES